MANVNIRVNDELKKNTEHIFEELGLTMSSATNMFYKQVVRYGGIPFDLQVYDPFYFAKNMTWLKKSMQQADEGKFISKSLEELQEMEQ